LIEIYLRFIRKSIGEKLAKKNSFKSDEVFEAVSHPQRIKILKRLAESPIGFSELKRVLNIESSGALDFHLKKMESLLTMDADGHYTLNEEGYAALEAINAIERYGWYKRAFYINIALYVFINLWGFASFSFSLSFFVVLALSTLWTTFYSYWMLIYRRIFHK